LEKIARFEPEVVWVSPSLNPKGFKTLFKQERKIFRLKIDADGKEY